MIPFVKLILRPKMASFKRQISTYSPEVIKKDKDTCLLQSHLPPKKVSCGTEFLLLQERAILHSKVKYQIWNFHGEKKQKTKNSKTDSVKCLQKVSLLGFSMSAFSNSSWKWYFVFKVLELASAYLSTCWCWEIHIFTCWMCKVDRFKLKITTSCYFHAQCRSDR